MNKSTILTSLALGSLVAMGSAHATGHNPFSAQQLNNAYQNTSKANEGKCGEGKCGGSATTPVVKTPTEGKCGEGKCGGSH
ncbi:hypothetical protein [Psychrobacter sp. I-STPA6b]|uniref:HvfA family oxazolone/thioamide-modified RiPP metallophore n=1 Tax=Psychrobacter sp. I-STPA6b TaxID=2585718 RepID=UPI001D0C31A1|nr:hypothetical protein [Psychrobacter sp. I-STPA6b]